MLRSAQHDAAHRLVSFSLTRLVRTFANAPFEEQLAFARELLALRAADGSPLVRRAAIDATGMGAPLAESLAGEFGPRLEPVVFTAAVKEDLAYRTKRRLESRLSRLPDTHEIRRAFASVKRLVTVTGNLRFDAERTESGHADEFWAKALADYAAESQPVSRLADAYLADGAPIISPDAFLEAEAGWTKTWF
jgi:phage FluMu gp28-like protein